MSLHLHFAPDAGLLRRVLADELAARWKADPFRPPVVLVPNPFVKRWLTLRLAEEFGAVLGLQAETLERTIWSWLAPGPGTRRLAQADLQLVLAGLLRDDLLVQPEFAPVRRYLVGADGAVDALKRLQLAGFLARLFQEYEYNRPSVWDARRRAWGLPGMTACWLRGRPYDFGGADQSGARAHEAWQAGLYRRAVERLAGLGEARPWTLPQLLEERRRRDPAWRPPPGRLHLFLVPKISHWHRNLLVDASQAPGLDLHVYLTNPCAEFWEDVDTSRRPGAARRRWTSEDQTGPDGKAGIGPRSPADYQSDELPQDRCPTAGDPRLLALWGRSARENISLWCPAARWDFAYHSPSWLEEEDDGTDGCLRALQRSLLRRSDDLAPGVSADASLQVLAAPDPGREMEELRDQVLDALADPAASGAARLEDVAVLVPDLAAYVPHIHRVFGATAPGEPGHIPFHIVGAPGASSLYAQAVESLLVLLEGRFDRAAVFALLKNPVWQAGAGADPAAVEAWEAWAAATGMVRGYDGEHRRDLGDLGAAATDAHSFTPGIARLLAGSLAGGAVDLGFPAPLAPYRDFETSDAASLELFLFTLEGLRRDFGGWKDLPLAEAVAALSERLDRRLPRLPQGTEWNPAAEGRVRKDFREALAGLRDTAAGLGCGPVSTPELLALVRGLLPAELPAPAKAWIGGVTFAPLRPGLVLPHPVLCVAGLGARDFPGSAERPELDLLAAARKVGDSHPVRDNQLCFLELLHAAGRRLVLSWRSKDLQKEEDLPASSVLLELLDWLRARGVDPLEDGNLPVLAWEGLSAARPRRTWSAGERRIAEAAARPRALWRFPAGTTAAAARRDAGEPLPLSALEVFLANPLQHLVTRILGLSGGDEPGALEVRDEPLAHDALQDSLLKGRLWTALLAAAFPESPGGEPRDEEAWLGLLHREAAAILRAAAAGAPLLAPFDRLAGDALVRWGEERLGALAELRKAFGDHRLLLDRDLALGRPDTPAVLDLGGTRITGRHRMALAPRSGSGTWCLLRVEKTGEAATCHKLWLQAAVQGLHERTLPAGARVGGLALALLPRADKEKKASVAPVRGLDDPCWQELAGWLRDLAGDLLAGRAEHLPYEAVREAFGGGDAGFASLDPAALADLLAGEDSPYRCFDEAWQLVEARLPPGTDEVRDLARRRFGPILLGSLLAPGQPAVAGKGGA